MFSTRAFARRKVRHAHSNYTLAGVRFLSIALRHARVGPHTLYHEHHLIHATLVGCEMRFERDFFEFENCVL